MAMTVSSQPSVDPWDSPKAYGHTPQPGENGVYVRTHNAMSYLATLEYIPVRVIDKRKGKVVWLVVESLTDGKRYRVRPHNVHGEAEARRWYPSAAAVAFGDPDDDLCLTCHCDAEEADECSCLCHIVEP